MIFDPHLTLNSMPTSNLPDPERALKKLVSHASSLLLEHPKLTMGHLFTQSVYMRFAESTILTNLYERSCEILNTPSVLFYPHLSLIYKNLDEGVKADMIKEMNILLDQVTFDSIRVVKSSASVETKADVDNWQIICEEKLTG